MARMLNNITGERFGKLLVLGRDQEQPSDKQGNARWMCRCECGNVSSVRGFALRSGTIISCGCLRKERVIITNTRHGLAKRGTYSYLYAGYLSAIQRCRNPRHKQFHDYGGRGIELRLTLDEWVAELGLRPSPKHSVDRVNNDGHYERGNLRWATSSEQLKNRRPRKKNPSSVNIPSTLADTGS